MSYQTNIQVLDKGQILAECGPMRLIIGAWQGQVPQRESCIQAAKHSFGLLEKVAEQRSFLSRYHQSVPENADDLLPMKMLRSVLAVDHQLTPMAAVAGTIADGVADFLFNRGMTKVIVNNGGDISIRTGTDESVKVGIRPDLVDSPISHTIRVGDDRSSWGVATSGLEGRSLTAGVASAATIIAENASLADAAATSIANASFIKDDSVIQRPARELDEQTDIPGVYVTIRAGPFSEEKKDLALQGAMEKANKLIEHNLIFGAYVVVDEKVRMTDFVRHRLTGLS
ncbi:MAG: hypothetical protein HOE30_21150 [Deltaproteobacteria bacterium]|jgi:uncharacterized protein|nr:hypothetical protein [Deltaproteobacteria bacterium]MBT4265298.1 hypothetical protein [Deltaproteobacteria bacterium]MBT4637872.1 hypothetical protein [Deltaproteobacteria bacterium]MBT6615108.1 hypothetical protein [Deltaproteobacteria bacterium]